MTHKIKTKVKYISISKILLLLSASDPFPHAVSVLASLVLKSKAFHKFYVGSNFKFDCCLVSLYIKSKSKEIGLFIVVSWMKFFSTPCHWMTGVQQHQQQPQGGQQKFDDETEELEGHVFDMVGSKSADLFV